MRKIAFVFPGQGSQYIGMGQEFYESFPEARAVFACADAKIGFPLSSLCFNGPEEDLKLTINTQPGILTASVAILKVLQKTGITAEYVAGHSLGEYTALVSAGALDFNDAVFLVRQRGAFMQEAVPPGEGTMAAIMGLEPEGVEKLCREVTAAVGQVEPANYNAPGQIVIAGLTPAVAAAMEKAKEFGAKRAIQLPVSGPFHSSLLYPASLKLQKALEEVEIKPAGIPVIANIDSRPVVEPEQIKSNLVEQVSGAVRWQQSMEEMLRLGVTTFVEIGPGKILSGLIKKVDKNVEMFNIEDVASFTETVNALKEA